MAAASADCVDPIYTAIARPASTMRTFLRNVFVDPSKKLSTPTPLADFVIVGGCDNSDCLTAVSSVTMLDVILFVVLTLLLSVRSGFCLESVVVRSLFQSRVWFPPLCFLCVCVFFHLFVGRRRVFAVCRVCGGAKESAAARPRLTLLREVSRRR